MVMDVLLVTLVDVTVLIMLVLKEAWVLEVVV